MTVTVSIPANGTWVKVPVGDYIYFFVRAAASPFDVSFDGGRTWSTRYVNDQDKPPGPRPNSINFRAYLGVGVDVTFEVGNSQFTAQSTAVTGNITAATTNNIADNAAVVPLQFAKVGNVANPLPLANAVLYFRWCLIIAVKAVAGTSNAGDVKIGFGADANQQPITLAPGDQYVLPIPVGAKVDFQNVHLAIATAGDGVVALYV